LGLPDPSATNLTSVPVDRTLWRNPELGPARRTPLSSVQIKPNQRLTRLTSCCSGRRATVAKLGFRHPARVPLLSPPEGAPPLNSHPLGDTDPRTEEHHQPQCKPSQHGSARAHGVPRFDPRQRPLVRVRNALQLGLRRLRPFIRPFAWAFTHSPGVASIGVAQTSRRSARSEENRLKTRASRSKPFNARSRHKRPGTPRAITGAAKHASPKRRAFHWFPHRHRA
jgi:hypothetical protein